MDISTFSALQAKTRPDAWHCVGGVFGFGIAYERRDTRGRVARATARHHDGRTVVDPIECPQGMQTRRAELEATVNHDLDCLSRTDKRYLFDVCGIDSGSIVKSNRGRKPKWTNAALIRLADEVAQAPLAKRSRRTHQLMQEAERRGIVRIERSAGRRNAYIPLQVSEPQPTRASGERVARQAWSQLTRLRDVLNQDRSGLGGELSFPALRAERH